jgi:DNA-binding beta-propeller fold protein YncE
MNKTFRFRKAWPLQLFLGALILWVAQGVLVEKTKVLIAYPTKAAEKAPDDARPILIERAPVRFIKDPNPSFSAVALNPDHNMLVVADENLFRVVEYDRRDSTPPKARMTEPKRMISGTNTKFEMACGVYIDPATQDVYVLNGDTQSWMPVFSTDARGNATPNRFLHTTGGHPFGMAVDEVKQELFMSQESGRIAVYRKSAAGDDKPIRTIEGPDTQLVDPHGIALDTKNKLVFVSNYGNGKGKFQMPSITVYPLDASGNTKPLWIIQGAQTKLNWPSHIAAYEERQELFVANDADDSVLIFRENDKGDVAPIRALKGPNTGIKFPTGIAVDTKNGEVAVANMGNASVRIFSVTADGDAKPVRTIRGGPEGTIALNIGNPGAVGYDSKRQQILVPN